MAGNGKVSVRGGPPPKRGPRSEAHRQPDDGSGGTGWGADEPAPATPRYNPAALVPHRVAPLPDPEPESLAAGVGLRRVRTPHATEPEHQHAALLLWALCHPDHRSWARLSDALGAPGCGPVAIARWAARWSWGARAAATGPRHDREAAWLYRETYVPVVGTHAVQTLQRWVRPTAYAIATAPVVGGVAGGGGVNADDPGRWTTLLGADDPAGAAARVRYRVATPKGDLGVAPEGPPQGLGDVDGPDDPPGADAAPDAPQGTSAAVAAAARHVAERQALAAQLRQAQVDEEVAKRRTDQFMQGAQRLIEGLVGQFAQVAGRIDVDTGQPVLAQQLRVSDLPKLLDAHRLLRDLTAGDPRGGVAGGAVVEPSYRVARARAEGTSVLDALRDDWAEVGAVLEALAARDDVSWVVGADGLPVVAADDVGATGEPPQEHDVDAVG